MSHDVAPVQGRTVTGRVPPHLYFVGSAVFHYLGPALAVLLFTRIEPLGVAWLRIVSAALVLALWRRPWRLVVRRGRDARRSLDSRTARLLVAWGVIFAVMNATFYLAIDRLPLGTVAAIEFIPAILLAAVAVRTLSNVAALALAVTGVYLLTDVHFALEPVGIAFAAANAMLFAGYIIVGHRVAQGSTMSGIDGLAIAMITAAVVAAPVGVADAATAFGDVRLLAAGVGVGICSSVIPYVFDQLAMSRLPRGTYALLVSILPATATIIGVVVLAQIPGRLEIAGVVLVIAGVAIHRQA
jgi:inner membrane transporter RhtA